MSAITIQDLLKCASRALVCCDDIPSPVSHTSISESELMCDERIIPEYPVAEQELPTMVNMHNCLLAFETKDMTPLCLKPPIKDCRKRPHDNGENDAAYARNESKTYYSKAPRREEEWLTWIIWGRAA